MRLELARVCDIHESDPWGCADRVIVKLRNNEYGLIIHDGGSAFYGIKFCPFCGTRLGNEERQ